MPRDFRSATVQMYPWGVVRWLHNSETGTQVLTFGEMTINPGWQNRQHYHPNCEEVLYVISGELEHWFEESKPVRLKAGKSLLMPPGMKHHSRCIGKEPVRTLVAYSSANHQTVQA